MQNKSAQTPQGSIDMGMATQPWRKGALASAVALALLGVSLDAQALALGAITVRSSLGEPLRAEIEVPQISSEEAASFQASVASPQAFRTAGVDYSPALAGARVTLHRRPNGQAYLRVTGERPVNEPFLGIVIDANWANGSVLRDYTMLVDPPGRAAPPPVTVTPAQTAPSAPVVTPAPAPVVQAPMAEQTTPAPAPRPRRAAAPATSAPAASGGGARVNVKRGDTAYALARAHRVEGVSLDQMLVAMLQANPNAFIRGNVNLMKAGAVINMPTAEQAAATSRQAARRTVVAQTRDFHAYRRSVAERAGRTRVAAASRTASGGVQAQVTESRAPAPAQDRLTLSRGGSPTGTETTVAQSRQAQEQAERVAELNKNIAELSRLQAASGSPAAAPAATPASGAMPAIEVPTGARAAAPVPTTATDAASAAVTAAASAAVDAASEAAAAAASATEAAVASAASAPAEAASEAVAAAPAPAPAPAKPRVVPPPPPVEEPSFFDTLTENPLLPVAGLGLLALLAGYGFYRSRQRKKGAAPLDSNFIESRLQADSFFGASGGQRVNTRDSGIASGSSSMAYSPSQLDAAGDVDPVAEADVYLAYGRDMQAEEILKEALRTHPGRTAIHRKLAEIYAKRRDARALEAIATEAYGISQGQGPDWLAITSLGSELEPTNPLYQPGGAPSTRPVPMPSRPSFGADTEPQTAQVLDAKGPDSLGSALDLDLDLDDAPVRAVTTAPAPLPPSASAMAPAAVAAGMGAAAAGAAAAFTPPPPPAPAPVADTSAPLDFDLGLDFSPPSDLGETQPPMTPVATAPTPAPAAPAMEPDAGMIDFDMDALSIDPDSRSGGELRTEQPEDADDDPLGTKLALAQEFHAIGDNEGARALVKEVIAESSGAMRARAERFLAELN